MKLSPLLVVFSCKGFHVNMMFFFISYFFIVSLIITFDIIIVTRIPMTLVLEHINDHLFNLLSHSYNLICLNRLNTNKRRDDENQNVVLRRHNHPPHQDGDNYTRTKGEDNHMSTKATNKSRKKKEKNDLLHSFVLV